MAADPQGLFVYPGIKQPIQASMTFSHGTTPSVATFSCAPQDNDIPAVADMFLRFGRTVIRFPQCRVNQASIKYDQGGYVTGLQIFDRRWKWAFGAISGQFNVVRPPCKSVLRIQRKSAKQLAAMCLEAMGETGFDVSGLPSDVYPPVEWDYTNPSRALSELVQPLGCRVVLRPLSNTVLIAKVGFGAQLPVANRMSASASVTKPPVPDNIVIVCGKSKFNEEIPLYAVGQETDGSTRLIDHLSYTPEDGWSTWNGVLFNIPDTPRGIAGTPRECCERSVWKWYSVCTPNQDGFEIRAWGNSVQDIGQLLPLDNQQVHYSLTRSNRRPTTVPELREASLPGYETVNGEFRFPYPPVVFGVFHQFGNTNTAERTGYPYQFNIVGEKGIVQFDRQVYKLLNPGTPNVTAKGSADIFLRTGFSLRDYPNYDWVRLAVQVPVPGAMGGVGNKYVLHDEIVFEAWPNLDYATGEFSGISTNFDEIKPKIDYYLKMALLEYQQPTPEEATFAGIIPIDLDGAIQQVGWSVGPSGATTRASRANEYSAITLPYKDREFQARIIREDMSDRQEDFRNAQQQMMQNQNFQQNM